MPPKTKIPKDMVLDAAMEIVRSKGIEGVNARSIAARLGCSTHPVMHCFKTMDELRRALYTRAEDFHTAYITGEQGENAIFEVGAAYVRFAAEEKHLFRFLFQSDHIAGQSIVDLMDDPSIQPLSDMLCQKGLSRQEARDAFLARFLVVHGMASLLANNSMVYNKAETERISENLFPTDSPSAQQPPEGCDNAARG